MVELQYIFHKFCWCYMVTDPQPPPVLSLQLSPLCLLQLPPLWLWHMPTLVTRPWLSLHLVMAILQLHPPQVSSGQWDFQ